MACSTFYRKHLHYNTSQDAMQDKKIKNRKFVATNNVLNTNLTVRLHDKMYKALEQYAKECGVSVGEVVRQTIGALLDVEPHLKKTPVVVEKGLRKKSLTIGSIDG